MYVERAVRRLSWSNISAAIDGDPYFAKGPVPSDGFLVWDEPSAWHVVRVHNFCRVMGANCEPVGSRMTALWESHGHPSISRLMDAVVLKDAELHFLGTARDEYVIRAVGDALLSLGMKPCLSEKWHRRRHGCEKPAGVRSRAMDLAFLASENAARKSGRDVTLGFRLDSSSEESGDEGEGEAFEKLDFLKTYSSRVQLEEHMATLARESRPQIQGASCWTKPVRTSCSEIEWSLEWHLSHITQACKTKHPAKPINPCKDG